MRIKGIGRRSGVAPNMLRSIRRPRLRRGSLGMAAVSLTAALFVIVVTAGCGGSSSGASSAATSSAGTARTADVKGYVGTVDAAYTGPDKHSITALPAPEIKKGAHFKVGYLQINGAVHVIHTQQVAASEEIKALGGSTVLLDAQNNPNTQVQQLKQLLDEGVNAIIAAPIIPQGLANGFKQAAAQHIPVVVLNSQSSLSVPHVPNTVTDVDQAMDYSTFETMKAITSQVGKGSPFAIMSLGVPIPVLTYQTQRDQYWGQQDGLKFLGAVPAAAATPAAYSAAAKSILTKYPTVKAIATVNDEAAVATAGAAQTLGKSNVQIFTANGGDPLSVPLLKNGRLRVVYRVPWEEQGIQAAIAAYDAVTKQHEPIPPLINLPGTVVTKANVSKVPFS